MNKVMQSIIDEIDQNFKCLKIDFKDDSWRGSIPSEAGWYLIKTNTPIAVLKFAGPPKYKAHINIPDGVPPFLVPLTMREFLLSPLVV